MYAKYIKREIPDLNGTGRTQASPAEAKEARNIMCYDELMNSY